MLHVTLAHRQEISPMNVDTSRTPPASGTDRIEKQMVLRAPRSRVWRAVASAQEFGAWFRMRLESEFVEGAAIRGQLTVPGYEHVSLEMWIERIEPERYFAYRWHPYAV